MGSNKVLQVALGRSAEEEYQPQTSELAGRIRGSVGLIFTSLEQQQVQSAAYKQLDQLVSCAGLHTAVTDDPWLAVLSCICTAWNGSRHV